MKNLNKVYCEFCEEDTNHTTNKENETININDLLQNTYKVSGTAGIRKNRPYAGINIHHVAFFYFTGNEQIFYSIWHFFKINYIITKALYVSSEIWTKSCYIRIGKLNNIIYTFLLHQ